ncbi:MAG: NUDIX domain-containing protein [Rickettsiales bacterium]|jgi:adhesin HecA-like repeat protein|nr:NUDIX domain-containing protein [Rickettsiales bacterium]
MAEMLDVYDANRKLLGTADRNVVHAAGLWHRTVHCWIGVDGKIIFQRRSRNLDNNAGKLYTTASGHVSAGETLKQAFEREIAQEIGLKIEGAEFVDEIVWVADMKKKDGTPIIDRVFANVCCALLSGGDADFWKQFRFTDGEVDGVVAIDSGAFLELCAAARDAVSGAEWDGRKLAEIKLAPGDFVLNSGETLSGKYGKIAEFINKGKK